MKKIIISLAIIAAAAVIVIGATTAYFSDTETSTGNTFSTGVIDINIDNENPWTESWDIEDMKPCETGYINFVIHNPGDNPVNIWKHIKNITTDDGDINEPECVYNNNGRYGVWDSNANACCKHCGAIYEPKHNLHDWMYYDLSVRVPIPNNNDDAWWQTIYKDEDKVTVGSIESQMIFLGMIPALGTMEVTQSYHLRPETGNWAQADTMTFDIEIYAEQLTGSLVLENKTGAPDWQILGADNIKGTLTYNLTSPTFDYTFTASGLKASTEYRLIYYTDPWAGDNPGALIASFTTDGSGDISLASGSIDLGMDLPNPTDQNYPQGAKIWLVTASDYNSGNPSTGPMTGWNPADYLFDTALMTYDNTDTP